MGAGNAFLPVYVFFVVVCAYIIYPGIPRSTATAWIGIYLLYTSIRTVATYLYHDDANRTDAERVTQWRRFVFCSAFTHGIILGSLAVIALPILAPTRQLLLTCFVLLVTTGAILYVSAILPALLILIFAALMPFVMIGQIRPGVFELPVSNFLLGALFANLFLSVVHYRNNSKLFFFAAEKAVAIKELEHKNRELVVADRARVQLLAVTSHDLRQPVHALRLILAHASENDEKEVICSNISKLRRLADLIAQMLLEMMDLSALEHEADTKNLESISLESVLQQLKVSQEPLAEKKGLQLDIQCSKDVWVLADASLLRRMLLNLVSNAIKYTHAGRVVVECNVQEVNVVISVRDTGAGIPQSRLDDIFKPYVRLDHSVADNEGAGLGLAIVHRAAVVQGFDIYVASTMGVGSVFELNVPLAKKRMLVEKPRASPASVPSARLRRIAVVDDDFFAREALIALLKHWGYETVSGESISALRGALRSFEKPGLIIADNQLGEGEWGTEAISAVREIFKDENIPGIVITGDTSLMLDGFVNMKLMHKPLDPGSLRNLLAKLLDQSSSSHV